MILNKNYMSKLFNKSKKVYVNDEDCLVIKDSVSGKIVNITVKSLLNNYCDNQNNEGHILFETLPILT